MIDELIPLELHEQLNAFRHDLEKITSQHIDACPFCGKNEFYLIRSKPTTTYRCKACYKYFTVAVNTPFSRLTPFNWLEIIFINRIQNQSYNTIANNLGCSVEKVMRRDHAMIDYLKSHYHALYQWYTKKQQSCLNPVLIKQHKVVSEKITALLNVQNPTCIHCGSTDTTKVGSRTCYRCKRCRHSFNILNGTKLNRLPKPELWLQFIDLLVAGETNAQLEKKLKLTDNTIRSWRSTWCTMMKQWNCDALAIWCQSH
ncbi:IS1 family transposase [Gilliamella sp. B2969]|uniref:hypothetical protein n=1 Tax=unclassified Gilliamella TaxID=2685620 RepID=UPI00226AC8A1|nr:MULTISPECIES: hypothetical protein [unclassified Gilliamella]MCX8711823.1 IS1 family transposase [Gilliamella sp. B3468]MCX8728906.1 IS1 family transposase [Gilliamella sp. B2969]MCX8738516.1 IS1 family transposase [Gilliamella sp. B2824]MCX8750873.1 IS1 family transposase [Gilliamella sp. B3464]